MKGKIFENPNFFGWGLNVPSSWKSDAQKRQNSIAKFLCRDRDSLFRDWTVVKIDRSEILTVQSRKRNLCQGKEWAREFCHFRATLFQLLGCIFCAAQASWPHRAISNDKLTYWNIPLVLVKKFLGVPLKIAGRRLAIFKKSVEIYRILNKK